MDLNTLGNLSDMAGVKLVLASTSPFQGLIDRPGVTHEFCNRQAIAILRQEGMTHCADFFQKYMKDLNEGVYWADCGWKNTSHYYVPTTGTGLWRFKSAVEEFDIYFRKAVNSSRTGDFRKTAFYLGAAIHLVQDACVPHHARARLFDGHKEYEGWARINYANFSVSNAVPQTGGDNFKEWLINNAVIAADMLDMVNQKASEDSYRQATEILLPQAQRSTAGVFSRFYSSIIQMCYSPAMLKKVLVVA